MSRTQPAAHKTLAGVQYARGIAALLVVFYHTAAQMAIDPAYGRAPHPALEYGYVGVSVFFIISGFIISIVSLDANFKPRVRIGDFAEKRIVRILPFMWLAIIAYNLLSFFGTGAVEWGAFLRAMTLWPSGAVKPNVIWTLRHEALFYIVFAVAFLNPNRRRIWLVGAWCLSPILSYLVLPPLPQVSFGSPPFRSVLFANVNLLFGVGLLMGLITLRHPRFMAPTWRGGAAAIYAGGVAVAVIAWWNGWRYGFQDNLGVLLVAAPLVVLAVRLTPTKSVFDRTARLIGDASYAIYLFHNLIIVPGLIAGRRTVDVLGIWPTYFGIICLAVVAGIVTHLLVERPLIAAISRRLPRNTRSDRALT